ncbi:MAG TPA: hypothetical protein VMI72_10135 [Roseiarcus sp.]|nr:hypothetical protein [Roseiarcus sp.]
MKGLMTALLIAASAAVATPAPAAIVDYYISGSGSGSLDGTDWSGSFLITIVVDNSTAVCCSESDPLVSASVDIPGDGTATLLIPTRLGISGAVIYFSRGTSIGGFDLFDFNLSPADAAAFNFQAGYGPVTGTGVFALNQFQDIPTSLGSLSVNTSSDVQFWSAAGVVPEASTWVMMLAGFAGLALSGYKASRRSSAAA